MLTKEKQKAVLESMLFLSTQPVPIAKMVRKLKQISRRLDALEEKQTASQSQSVQDERFTSMDVENSEAISQDVDTFSATDEIQVGEQVEKLEDEMNDLESDSDSTEDSLDLEVSDSDIDAIDAEETETDETETDEADAEALIGLEDGADVIDIRQFRRDQGESLSVADENESVDAIAAEEIPGDEDIDFAGDVMRQLMQKQQELEDEITSSDVKDLLDEMAEELKTDNRGLELVAVAKGYQFRTKYEISQWLKDEKIVAPSRFSPSSLETLAIIAYQQPITRQKIEELRGVDSGGVVKTLLEKTIVRVVGRSEEPGRPLVYGTSQRFLEIFGLKNLKDLPSIQDYQSLGMAKDTESERSESDNEGIFIDDLLDSDLSAAMSEEDDAILGDLDDSLKNLRDVEKDIFASETQETEVTQGENGG